MSRPIVVIICMDAPPNRGSFNSAHIFGTYVPGGGAVHSINTGLMHRSKRRARCRGHLALDRSCGRCARCGGKGRAAQPSDGREDAAPSLLSRDLLVLQNLIKCPANDFVAFARRCFQPLRLTISIRPRLFYEVLRLQRLCDQCYARSAQSQHIG